MAWDPPPLSSNIYASEVMSHPAVVFKSKESVGKIVDTLKKYTYNGFPVVDDVFSVDSVNKKIRKNKYTFLFLIVLNFRKKVCSNQMVVYEV